jgi:very-short-patch-repair endonuclease
MADLRKPPGWQVSTKQLTRARSLRRDSTEAEKIVWDAIRARQVHGANFRRQKPIGPFIVDFVCPAANLIVELDGGQHFESEHMKRDARRDAFLASKGYRVMRFNNHDVMTNREGVLETIAAAVEHTLSPPLPRKRGREQTARGATP